jgi:MYXO-CTERM domain-containing protein
LLKPGVMLLRIALLTLLLPHVAFAEETSTIESQIVGGSPVPEGKWRDVVAVIGESATCTGTLIAPDIVLTAGHCIDIEPYEVRTDTIDYTGVGDRIPVKWARAYPDWDRRYDIGVIMLEHVARGRHRKIAAACEAKRQLTEGAMVHLVGFGMTGIDGSNTLMREADVRIIDPTCTQDDSCEPSVAPHGEFMAGGNGTDSCFGDSGGPVFVDTAEGPALIGVVSRGLAIPGSTCGDGGVYVRADKVVAWVQSVTGVSLDRTLCDGSADDGGEEEETGGCSAGGGGMGLGAIALLGIVRRRRRAATC